MCIPFGWNRDLFHPLPPSLHHLCRHPSLNQWLILGAKGPMVGMGSWEAPRISELEKMSPSDRQVPMGFCPAWRLVMNYIFLFTDCLRLHVDIWWWETCVFLLLVEPKRRQRYKLCKSTVSSGHQPWHSGPEKSYGNSCLKPAWSAVEFLKPTGVPQVFHPSAGPAFRSKGRRPGQPPSRHADSCSWRLGGFVCFQDLGIDFILTGVLIICKNVMVIKKRGTYHEISILTIAVLGLWFSEKLTEPLAFLAPATRMPLKEKRLDNNP